MPTQAWNTANLLKTTAELDSVLAKGLKIDVTTTLNPSKNAKGAVLGATYKHPGVHATGTVDLLKVSSCPLAGPSHQPFG